MRCHGPMEGHCTDPPQRSRDFSKRLALSAKQAGTFEIDIDTRTANTCTSTTGPREDGVASFCGSCCAPVVRTRSRTIGQRHRKPL